jgi:hypothetical protein
VVNIVDVRDVVIPIRSDISNAFIAFSSMTVSVVAVVTDVSLLRSLTCEAHRTADRDVRGSGRLLPAVSNSVAEDDAADDEHRCPDTCQNHAANDPPPRIGTAVGE